jgi:hypothetical protein
MTPFKSEWTALACHPTAVSGAVRGVDIRLAREASGSLALRYVLTVPPQLTVRAFDDRLELDATFGLDGLKDLRAAHTLKLAVSAVVEDDSGTLSYWALKHAPGRPDFHHGDGFVLELPGEPMSQPA